MATTAQAAFADFNDVQGNILGGFLKNHQAFLLLHIEDAASVKKWLVQLAQKDVATSREVVDFNNLFKRLRDRRHYENLHAGWMNIAFTRNGLAKIGVTATDIAAMDSSFATENLPDHARSALLDVNESDPNNWKTQYRDGSVDIVVIVAADDPEMLDGLTTRYTTDACNSGCRELDVERGNARPDLPGHEHFGFKDGVSQPPIAELNEPNGLPAAQFIVQLQVPTPSTTTPEYQPSPQPPPPSGPPVWCQNGSYMVFRRLRQYVDRFNAFVVNDCPAHLTRDVFRAKIVGRYKSGTPLAHMNGLPNIDTSNGDPAIGREDIEEQIKQHWNDFTFAADVQGGLMPAGAHIRKVNPRDVIATSAQRRILRRGIAYGEPYSDVPESQENSAEADRGLLFVCYQASIANQFEFIQQSWANAGNFPADGQDHGQDIVIGQTEAGEREFVLPTPGARIPFQGIAPFVVTTGTLYCFQPSISALQLLGSR